MRISDWSSDVCSSDLMIGGCVFFRHDLYIHGPARKVFVFDGFEQIALRTFAVLADQFTRLLIGKVLDALLGLEMKFDPVALIAGIDEAEGVAAEQVHVATAEIGSASGRERVCQDV